MSISRRRPDNCSKIKADLAAAKKLLKDALDLEIMPSQWAKRLAISNGLAKLTLNDPKPKSELPEDIIRDLKKQLATKNEHLKKAYRAWGDQAAMHDESVEDWFQEVMDD